MVLQQLLTLLNILTIQILYKKRRTNPAFFRLLFLMFFSSEKIYEKLLDFLALICRVYDLFQSIKTRRTGSGEHIFILIVLIKLDAGDKFTDFVRLKILFAIIAPAHYFGIFVVEHIPEFSLRILSKSIISLIATRCGQIKECVFQRSKHTV